MPRPPSTAAQSAQPLQLPAKVAGRKIARFWRRMGSAKTTPKLVREYMEKVKLNGGLRSQTLEEMVHHMKLDSNKKIAKECFSRIVHLCARRHGPTEQSVFENGTPIQVLTAAYLVIHHTQRVFHTMGDNERVLLAASEQFLLQFHTIIDCINRTRPYRFNAVDELDTVDFMNTVATYLAKFKAWKEPDQALLVARIRTTLLALYSASAHTPRDSPVIRMELVHQITRLRAKYEQIMGAAHLAAFDAAHSIDGVPELSSSDTLMPVTSPETGRLMSVEKRQLAHEILIDPDFAITEQNFYSVGLFHLQEARQIRAEFWDNLRAQLAVGDYTNAIRVVTSLRDTLYSSCMPSEFTRIQQELPLERFAERTAQGQVPWEDVRGLFNTIAVLAKDIMMPERQDDFEERWLLNAQKMDASTEEDRVAVLADTLGFFSETSFFMGIDASNKK